MLWARANATQEALAAAETHFLDVCDSEDEIDPDTLEEAEEAMQRAAAEADEAFDEIKACRADWAASFARVLR